MTLKGAIEDHEGRCQSYLAALFMLAHGEAGAALPRQAAAEIIRATGAVLAEAEAAGREAESAGADPGAATLLLARLNRLSAAGDDIIAAARAGNAADMRRHVRRFETLTFAIWTVRQAVSRPASRRPAGTSALLTRLRISRSDRAVQRSSSAARPGRVLPSMNSRLAPPPVET